MIDTSSLNLSNYSTSTLRKMRKYYTDSLENVGPDTFQTYQNARDGILLELVRRFDSPDTIR